MRKTPECKSSHLQWQNIVTTGKLKVCVISRFSLCRHNQMQLDQVLMGGCLSSVEPKPGKVGNQIDKGVCPISLCWHGLCQYMPPALSSTLISYTADGKLFRYVNIVKQFINSWKLFCLPHLILYLWFNSSCINLKMSSSWTTYFLHLLIILGGWAR